jgi:hypothetical protein
MYNKTRSQIAKQQPRDAKGRFVDTDNPKTKKFNRDQLQSAFIAGGNAASSIVARSPSAKFRIWCKQMGLTK